MADLGPLWHAEGLDDPSWDDIYGQMYVHPFPPSFGQRPDSSAVRPARATGAPPAGQPPGWVRVLGAARPCVYVTSGTERTATTFPWRDVFAVIAGLDVDAVATIGSHVDPADVGPVPANVRLERFVPQADVLRRSAVVISHGGAGTVLGAASHGLPQFVVPLFADQWQNAVAVRDAGCGVFADPDNRSVDDIDAALRRCSTASAPRRGDTRRGRNRRDADRSGSDRRDRGHRPDLRRPTIGRPIAVGSALCTGDLRDVARSELRLASSRGTPPWLRSDSLTQTSNVAGHDVPTAMAL